MNIYKKQGKVIALVLACARMSFQKCRYFEWIYNAIGNFMACINFIESAKENKEVILQKWVDVFYSAYPLGSSGFVRTSKDRFTNPIGIITQSSLTVLYDAVLGDDVEPQKVQEALFDLIQLRAVQDMTPSKAVGPLAQLKLILKQEVYQSCLVACLEKSKDLKGAQALFDDFFIVEARIESLLLMAFDYYASDREKIFNLRVEEIHRNQSQLVRWAKVREEKLQTNHKEA